MSKINLKRGRVNQKLRTRKALLDAAKILMQDGRKPTLAEVADEAMVSKATTYRYFPNQEALFLEVTLDSKVLSPRELFENGNYETAEDRVARVQEFLYDLVSGSETQFRLFLRASMEQWLQRKDGSDEPLRGARRIPMLELALEPFRAQIDDGTYEKLLYALCVMVSLEPFIALMDVCQVDKDRGKEIMDWAVRTMVKAVLKE